MGFWIFMLVLDLLIPLTMIGFGRSFIKSAPKEINKVFGYRTTRSMKNRETWEFAHNYCGKLWQAIGYVMLVISLIAMVFLFGKDNRTVGSIGGIICGIQLIILLGSIFFVEQALKKRFDV